MSEEKKTTEEKKPAAPEEAVVDVISAEDLEMKAPEEDKGAIKAQDVAPPEEEEEKGGKKKKKRKKTKKKKIQLTKGNIYIQATYNNTMVSIADQQGNVVAQCSAGGCGFKGPKKATPFAASIVVRTIIGKIADSGLSEVDVFVKGVGQGRESAIRSFAAQGYKINVIKDVTPMPHNGPRQRKPRRV